MAEVQHLLPGDVVALGDRQAVYVSRCQHPLWPSLQLVIWRMDDGSWSPDALDANQDVGTVLAVAPEQRRNRLRHALLPREML